MRVATHAHLACTARARCSRRCFSYAGFYPNGGGTLRISASAATGVGTSMFSEFAAAIYPRAEQHVPVGNVRHVLHCWRSGAPHAGRQATGDRTPGPAPAARSSVTWLKRWSLVRRGKTSRSRAVKGSFTALSVTAALSDAASALVSDCSGYCHTGSSFDSACNSRSVSPCGWLSRHDEGLRSKTGDVSWYSCDLSDNAWYCRSGSPCGLS